MGKNLEVEGVRYAVVSVPMGPVSEVERKFCSSDTCKKKSDQAGGVEQRFIIWGVPMGKPRMTQRDRWYKRGVVEKYWEWKAHAQETAPKDLLVRPWRVDWVAYLPIPKSYSKKKRAVLVGQLHQGKPDRDNIDKALLDALWSQDSCVACGMIEKRWDDGKGARLEVVVRG